jgi:hypothetical protein
MQIGLPIETGLITSVAAVLIVVFVCTIACRTKSRTDFPQWSAMPDNALWLAAMLIYAHRMFHNLAIKI